MKPPQNLFDGELYCVGDQFNAAPLTRSTIRGGRIIHTMRLSAPQQAQTVTAANGSVALYITEDKKAFAVTASTGRVTALPYHWYVALSPDGRYARTFWQTEQGNGAQIVDVRTGRVVWQSLGVVCPAWNAAGNKLFFARFLDKQHSLPIRYSYAPDDFPKLSEAARYARRRLCELRLTSSSPQERPCTLRDMKAHVGNWYGTLLDRSLEDNNLALPSHNVVQSPGGAGVWVMTSTRGPIVTSLLNDVTSTNFDRNGKAHVLKNVPPLDPIQWSQDGRWMYARRADRYARGDETVKRGFFCLDTLTKECYRLPLPPLLDIPLLLKNA